MMTVRSFKDCTAPWYQKAQVWFLETMQACQIQEEVWYLKNTSELN